MHVRFMRSPLARAVVSLALLSAASLLSGCGSGINGAVAAAISAPVNSVRVNQTVQLVAGSALTASTISYSVNGVPGGNDQYGHISSTGLYTAPALIPSPTNAVLITSVSSLFPTLPHSVMLSILNPIPIIGSISPATFPEGTATITITGSQFIYGAQIYWNGVAVPTTYISGTQLAASITAPNPGSYSITVSNPDPGAALSTAVAENVAPGKVVLTLQSGNGTSVRVANSIPLALTISGTNNTGINWLVNGVPNGNAQLGTISTNPYGTILYTAPPVVPVPSNIVTVTAVSVDNPAVSISQNIAVDNPIPILQSASPSTFNIGSATVVVTGSSFINGAQVLVNGAPTPTTFNTGNQLTATINPTISGNLDIQVLNPNPGAAASADFIASVTGNPPTPIVTPTDASRFLAQATFGPTDSDIRILGQLGYPAWFAQQFAIPPTPHAPYVEQQVILNNPPCAASDSVCNGKLFLANGSNENYVQQAFWQQALTGPDQLRQRLVFALTEMFVVSSANSAVVNSPRGEANYYDVLGADVFGNFRQLLEDITLNPMMGEFLSVQGNDKGDANRDPDENYAREVMQLFTIGLYQLNPDGSQKLDPTGNPIPTYSNTDVQGLAKVFTGWSWNVPGDSSDNAWSGADQYAGPGYGQDILPMQAYPSHHSILEKDFLGTTIPASASPDTAGDLKIALDTLFNHPNLPPFVCRQLIQHLVTSNPSPGYVARVAAVFQDDGLGVRGDMKAVIQAILLDDEARNAFNGASNPQFGKVREATVRFTEWARAFTAQSRNGAFNIGSTEDPIYSLGEMALRSPTVFNWFAPGYIPPGTSIQQAGLVAPEMQMTSVATVVGYLNYMQSNIGSNAQSGPELYSNYSAEIALAATPDALLDRINLLLMAGNMDSTLRSQILSAVNSVSIPTGDQNAINAALTTRVELAIYLAMASPAYSAQF